jgi:hypothetical protein
MQEDYTKHICMDISNDIRKFVDDEVFGEVEYLFIKNVGSGKIGHCTKCHNEFELGENYKHNSYGICPACNAKLQVKLDRYGKKNCMNDACFYYFEKSIIDPKIVICKGYYVTREYDEDYKKPVTDYLLEAIYIFTDKIGKMIKLNYSNFYGERWSEKKTVFDFNQGWLAPKMCYISRESIWKATEGTRFQYIPEDLFKGYISTIKIFEQFSKYPWLEQIYKMGFKEIVWDKLNGNPLYYCINYKGKDTNKILKLSRKDIKEIIKSGISITSRKLALYQSAVKDNKNIDPIEIDRIEHKYGYHFFRLKEILKYTTFSRASQYLDKQSSKSESNSNNIVTIWADYLQNAIELRYNMKDEHVIFPKSVKDAHDYTVTQVKVSADTLTNEKIRKRALALNEKYYFKSGKFFIKAAESVQELINEGSALKHCVATNYTKPYAIGSTNILLLRESKNPEKPFYTMELKGDSIIQLHGLRNCAATKEIDAFIKKFKEEKLESKKKKQKISIPA